MPLIELAVTIANATGAGSGPAAPPAACAKLQTCYEGVQNTPVTVTLTDNWFGDARTSLGLPGPQSVQAWNYYPPASEALLMRSRAATLVNAAPAGSGCL